MDASRRPIRHAPAFDKRDADKASQARIARNLATDADDSPAFANGALCENRFRSCSKPEGKSSSFRTDIQGLRALAVTLVILAHAKLPHFSGGFVGVDVFFVISGYVITGVLIRQSDAPFRQKISSFYRRRIRRILPASALVLVVTLIATGPLAGSPHRSVSWR